MDRLARYGSGWIPWGDDADDIEGGLARMRDAVARRDRDPLELGVVGALRVVKDDRGAVDLDRTMADVPRLHAAGITDFRMYLSPPSGGQPAAEYLHGFVTAFRAATS
jgi:hypothetical protein